MRRPRYKGKYPRNPKDKYKELSPIDYQEDIAHIEAKGRTVLGTHKPIMVKEILAALKPGREQRGLDLTLGYGGHSEEILKMMEKGGQLFAFDQDSIELKRTVSRLEKLGYNEDIFKGVHSNFRDLKKKISKDEKVTFDFVLADLGLSSMQIDRPERGFSLKHDTAIDFRMDSTRGKPALSILRELPLEDFKKILIEYADEPYPHRLGLAILNAVKQGSVLTTRDLKEVIIKTILKIKKYPTVPDKAVPRIFQAIRIHVNEELHALSELLEQLPDFLHSGSRVAFLTFHSGEDRQVKKFFKQGLENKIFSEIHGPIRAENSEIMKNRRASSAKLRWGLC